MKYQQTSTIIQTIAREQGVTETKVRRDMQEAIDVAWNTNDPAAKARQNLLFPNGKPTPEEFIDGLSVIFGTS